MGTAFTWIDINLVLPNDKNPRVDPSVKTEEIQNILKTKGFEQAITVYKNEKGPFYTILSGHRRWHAAKELGMGEIPIYVVPEPKDEVEEIERLGDVQGGQVDWTEYEWAEYTNNIYERLKISISDLAERMGKHRSIIDARIKVFKYYPRVEIEEKLANKTYGIRMLNYIRNWIEKLKEYQPELVEDVGEDKIRRLLLKKYENRILNTYIKTDETVSRATYQQLLSFIITPNKRITELKRDIDKGVTVPKIRNYRHNKKKVRMTGKEIESLKPRTKKEAEVLRDVLESLQREVAEKKEAMLRMVKSQEEIKRAKKGRKGILNNG